MKEPLPLGAVLGYRDACDHAGAELSRNDANGGIGMWCYTCRQWVTKQLGYDRPWLGKDHPALRGKNLDELPKVGARVWRKCQGKCGELAHCELHHIAPRAIFGDECDEWPMLWLCRVCHERWHTKVTPGLCTAYDPTEHYAMLVSCLGRDQLYELTKRLVAHFKRAA